MRAYHNQIIDNAVSYIAKRYYDAFNEPINQMRMYKILSLFDYACVSQIGRPCTEFTYLALQMGPVPNELYNGDESIYSGFVTKRFDVNGKVYKYYISITEPDMDYFSAKERKILDEIIDEFIEKNLTTNQASDLTHKRIKAWKKAWAKNPNGKMSYSDEFDDIFSKDKDNLSPEEEHFLIYNETSLCRNTR